MSCYSSYNIIKEKSEAYEFIKARIFDDAVLVLDGASGLCWSLWERSDQQS